MTDAGNLGIGANDVGLRVDGRPPEGWRAHHDAGHPGEVGSFAAACPVCISSKRADELAEATAAEEGAARKAEKQRAFLVAAEEVLVTARLEVQSAATRLRLSLAALDQEEDGHGLVG